MSCPRDTAYHLGCLQPPLEYVPAEDWLCERCCGGKHSHAEEFTQPRKKKGKSKRKHSKRQGGVPRDPDCAPRSSPLMAARDRDAQIEGGKDDVSRIEGGKDDVSSSKLSGAEATPDGPTAAAVTTATSTPVESAASQTKRTPDTAETSSCERPRKRYQ